MLDRIKVAASAAVLIMATSSCNDAGENVVEVRAEMYNVVVDESNLAAPATLSQDWSSFVFDFGKGVFNGDIKAKDKGVDVSFVTGEIPMTIGNRSFEFAKGAIMAGSQDVTEFFGMYDNRIGALTYDYKVNGKYHVYSQDSFTYNFCTCKKAVGSDITNINGMRFELIPNTKTNALTLIVYNFRKSPNHYPVNLFFENIPFMMSHGGAIVGERDTCTNSKPVEGDNSDYTATIVKAYAWTAQGEGSVQFDMDGAFYKIEGSIFTPVTNEK